VVPSGKRRDSREGSPGGDVGVRVMDDAAGPGGLWSLRRSIVFPVEPGSECRPVRAGYLEKAVWPSSSLCSTPLRWRLRGLEAGPPGGCPRGGNRAGREGTRPGVPICSRGGCGILRDAGPGARIVQPAPRPWRSVYLCAADRCVHRRRLGVPDLFRRRDGRIPCSPAWPRPYSSPWPRRVGPDAELAEQRHALLATPSRSPVTTGWPR